MIRILLVEDNPGDVVLVQQALDMNGLRYSLHVVRDGGEALEYLAQMGRTPGMPCPDVVLLDLNLPKKDGGEVLSEFRKHPECKHTRVIVITSSDAPRDRKRVAELGVNRYFRKPSDFEEFLKLGEVVREVVQGAL